MAKSAQARVASVCLYVYHPPLYNKGWGSIQTDNPRQNNRQKPDPPTMKGNMKRKTSKLVCCKCGQSASLFDVIGNGRNAKLYCRACSPRKREDIELPKNTKEYQTKSGVIVRT